MSVQRQKHHITSINVAGFFLNLACGAIGAAFPNDSPAQHGMWELGGAVFIAACTLTSFKLAREHWDIPAAGYTMLAIAFGVFYASNNDVSLFASGVILFVPSMFLIAYYALFPIWLRMLGLVACVPFGIILFQQYTSVTPLKFNNLLFTISFVLIQLTGLAWGIYFWLLERRAEKHD